MTRPPIARIRRRAASRRSLEAALVLVATASAGALFDGYFHGTAHRPYLLAAAGTGALTGLVAGLPGRARAVRALAAVPAVGGPVALLLWLYHPGSQGVPDALRLGVQGLHRGWSRMITVGLPAAATPDLLVLPAAAVWAAALAGTLLLHRPRARLVPMAPPTAAYLLALTLTAARTPARWLPAGLLLASVVLLVLVRPDAVCGAGRPSRDGRRDGDGAHARADGAVPDPRALTGHGARGAAGPLVAGLAAVLLVTGVGVAGASGLPDGVQRAPYDPRAALAPDQDAVDVFNPLLRIKLQLSTSPPVPLFSVAVDAPRLRNGLGRIRVVALDTFTGAVWEPSGRFLRPGASLPPDTGVNLSVPATIDVRVLGHAGTFLPVAGTPGEVRGDGLRVAVPQGNLITTDPGGAGQMYRVQTSIAAVDPDGVQHAVPDLSVGPGYTALPSPPPGLVRYARSVTAGEPSEYAKLKALESRLRDLPYGTAHAPGESYAVLVDMLGLNGTPAFPDSFAEQRASAFAVLARSLGFATRVAVGYVLSPEHRRQDGSYQVMTDDAHAWPEVRLAGYGWVAFEPTPPEQIAQNRPRDGTPPQPSGRSAVRGRQFEAQVNPQADATVTGGGGGEPGSSRWRPLWLVLLLVPAAPLLVVVAKAARRRRRRGAPTARQRVLGAWAEARDRLQEAGVPRDLALTPPQVVRLAGERLGPSVGEAVGELGPVVDVAACGPSEPGAVEVGRAWEAYARLRTALRAAGPVPVRLRRPFDPRPLLVRRARPEAGADRRAATGGPR